MRRVLWSAAVGVSLTLPTVASADDGLGAHLPAVQQVGQVDGEVPPDSHANQDSILQDVALIEEALDLNGLEDRATIQVDWEAEVVTVTGEAPRLGATLDSVASALSFPLRTSAADYDLVRLREVAAELFAADGLAFQLEIANVAVREDLSGLDVFVASPSVDIATVSRSLTAEYPAMSFNVVFDERLGAVMTTDGGRLNDIAPFVPGMRIERRTGFLGLSVNRCTGGFTVRNFANTARGLAFARHCNDGDTDAVWRSASGQEIGQTNGFYGNNDLVAIIVPTGSALDYGFRAKTYLGGYTGTTHGGITGSGVPVIGEQQCYSGSFSGTSCSNEVIQTNVYNNFGGPQHVTQQLQGQAAAGNGDSGGSNYRLGSGVRAARGIITGIPINTSQHRSCFGVPSGDGRVCSHIVFSTTIKPIIDGFGLIVATSAY